MALTPPPGAVDHRSTASKRMTLGLLTSISSLMALLAKRAGRVSIKIKTKKPALKSGFGDGDGGDRTPMFSPKSPLVRPKQLFSQISDKAIAVVQKKRRGGGRNGVVEDDEEYGDGGIWQKEILMGDKCQPLDYSGVIYYDSNGKQVSQLPLRSPRASPLPGYLTRGQLNY